MSPSTPHDIVLEFTETVIKIYGYLLANQGPKSALVHLFPVGGRCRTSPEELLGLLLPP